MLLNRVELLSVGKAGQRGKRKVITNRVELEMEKEMGNIDKSILV